jgi:hypothetical protein
MLQEKCRSFGGSRWFSGPGTYFRPVPHSAVIGEIDTDKDATIDFSAIRAEPLPQIQF